ncbi:endothelin-converting enzyme 2-like isoform X3 [Dermacentor albipictus]|uniref:endothelin-converting enzyme 2-like isoform X3 n=1 Tax=Dermacentor albipictus TaxID=60249 RepID=UPI0031FC74C6
MPGASRKGSRVVEAHKPNKALSPQEHASPKKDAVPSEVEPSGPLRTQESRPQEPVSEEEFLTEGPGLCRIVVIVVGTTGTLAILVVLTILVFLAPKDIVHTTPPPSLCTTFACIEHAYNLNKSMLRAVSPCDNFYQFVCGSWTAPRRRQTSVGQNMHDTIAGAIQATANHHPPESRLKGTRKAYDMYISCVEAHDAAYATDNVRRLKHFMHQHKLSISAENVDGVDPLDQLVDLSVNWNQHFIFEMAPHKPQGQKEWMLLLYPGLLAQYFSHSEQTGAAFSEYVRYHLAKGFGNPTDVIAAFPTFREEIVRQMAPLKEPLSTNKYPWLKFAFSEIQTYAPNIEAKHWRWIVNKHFASYKISFGSRSTVFVTDRRVLDVLNKLLDRTHNLFRLPVTSFIAWKFVELFGWILDDKIAEMSFDETEKQALHEARRVACADLVERTYAFAMSGRYLFEIVDVNTRGAVSSFLTSIQDAMLALTDNTTWMDDKSKGDFRIRVSDVERTIWITGISAYPGKLTALYKDFPAMGNLFVANWIESQKALSRKLFDLITNVSSATSESDRRTAYAEYRANSDPSMSRYVYHQNSITVPMSLLFKPMYVYEGTSAMNYAGLGALYAQLQIKMLDTVGVQFNEQRQLRSWMSRSPMERYDAMVQCFFSRESQGPAKELSLPSLRSQSSTRKGTRPRNRGDLPPVGPQPDAYQPPLKP